MADHRLRNIDTDEALFSRAVEIGASPTACQVPDLCLKLNSCLRAVRGERQGVKTAALHTIAVPRIARALCTAAAPIGHSLSALSRQFDKLSG